MQLSYKQVYFQVIWQLVLLLLHILDANCSHLQGVVIAEDMYSVLYGLWNISGNLLFLHSSVKPIVQLVGNKLVCTWLCNDLLSATAWQERGH